MLHVLFFVTIKAYILIVMSGSRAVLPWYIPPFCVYTLYKVPVDGVRPSTLGMNRMLPHPASILHVHSPGKGSLSIRRKQLKQSKEKRRNVGGRLSRNWAGESLPW
ncbi:hypothetical protein F5Y07DRAFT_204226 [Xylaria sp. FL0933]|nr:hypothetical protein F5Y07DRAFT_204226 [Xylaria sp. FL0933]